MRQGQGPEPEVRGSVGHGPQRVLNGVDTLKNKNLCKVEYFFGMWDDCSVRVDSPVTVDVELGPGCGLLVVGPLHHERLGQ